MGPVVQLVAFFCEDGEVCLGFQQGNGDLHHLPSLVVWMQPGSLRTPDPLPSPEPVGSHLQSRGFFQPRAGAHACSPSLALALKLLLNAEALGNVAEYQFIASRAGCL